MILLTLVKKIACFNAWWKICLFCIFFDGFCSFLDVCGCGLWWFGYEWGLSAGGFQSICCCFCSRVFKSYFTWDCTGDYLRLYLRCLWYLRETILEILFGFFVWNHVSFYLSIYIYILYCLWLYQKVYSNPEIKYQDNAWNPLVHCSGLQNSSQEQKKILSG